MNDPLRVGGDLVGQVAPVVRAILARKSGMTLADDDTRPDNVDALELYRDVLARLWERIVDAGAGVPALRDLKGYAAAVTYNAWSDHLREKYPKRASLKNRLRYFLSHQPAYAVWENADGDVVAGPRKWSLGQAPAASARLVALREQSERLPAGSVPAKPMERFAAEDWARLLDALFARLGGPAPVDELVGVVASLLSLQEERVESLDDGGLDDDGTTRDVADDDGPRPDRAAEMRSTLVRLWSAIRALRPEYRLAYLLNIPGAGRTRGDIDVFPLHGVASVTEIGAALALSAEHYALLWRELPLDPADRDALAALGGPDEQFCLLWKYLPLADTLIGRLLGLEQQQVINRRMLALRELARELGAAGRGRK